MKRVLFLSTLVLFLFSCSNFNKNANHNEYSLNDIDFCDIELVDSIGKEIIPNLIDSISINRKEQMMGYSDARNDKVDIYLNNYTGIEFALKIEYVLCLDYLDKYRATILDSNFCAVPLLKYGLIFRTEDDTVFYEKLCYSDMLKIQKIYSDWWNENKNRPLDSLQKDWTENKKPLNVSCGYVWK